MQSQSHFVLLDFKLPALQQTPNSITLPQGLSKHMHNSVPNHSGLDDTLQLLQTLTQHKQLQDTVLTAAVLPFCLSPPWMNTLENLENAWQEVHKAQFRNNKNRKSILKHSRLLWSYHLRATSAISNYWSVCW